MRKKILIAFIALAVGLTIGFGSGPSPRKYEVNPVTRAINGTTFTPHPTANVEARYVIELSVTQNVTGTSFSRVLMQFSEDNGSTWNDGEEAYFATTPGLV